jgi:DNA end-binding protein Ku
VRPSWNGHLRLSLVPCPIGLVPATTEVERIKLNQLNPKTGNRISLKPVDSETGEPLERSEIVKGYKLEGDQVRHPGERGTKKSPGRILSHP